MSVNKLWNMDIGIYMWPNSNSIINYQSMMYMIYTTTIIYITNYEIKCTNNRNPQLNKRIMKEEPCSMGAKSSDLI